MYARHHLILNLIFILSIFTYLSNTVANLEILTPAKVLLKSLKMMKGKERKKDGLINDKCGMHKVATWKATLCEVIQGQGFGSGHYDRGHLRNQVQISKPHLEH